MLFRSPRQAPALLRCSRPVPAGDPPPPPPPQVAAKCFSHGLGASKREIWVSFHNYVQMSIRIFSLSPGSPGERSSPEFLKVVLSFLPHPTAVCRILPELRAGENSLCMVPLLSPGCRFPAAVPDKERQLREGASSAEGHTAETGRAGI